MLGTPLDIDVRSLARGDLSGRGDGNVDPTTGIMLLFTLSFTTILLFTIVPVIVVITSAFAAAVFVGSIRLLSKRPWLSVRSAVAGFLALFVGIGFVVGIVFTPLELVRTTFPVGNVPALRAEGLRIVTATLAATTGTITLIGGFASLTGGFAKDDLSLYATVSAKAAATPLLGALILGTFVIAPPTNTAQAAVASDVFRRGVRLLLSPATNRPHFFAFLSLLFVTLWLFEHAVETLPESNSEKLRITVPRRIKTVVLGGELPIKAILGIGVSVSVLEFYYPTDYILRSIPWPVYRLSVGLTSSRILRIVLVSIIILSSIGWIVAWVHHFYSSPERYRTSITLLPFLSGVLVIGLIAGLSDPVLNTIITAIQTRLPGPFAREFTRQSTAVIDFYGSVTIVMALSGLLIALSGMFALGLHNLLEDGPISETDLAPALTGSGTFLTAAFAAETGVHPSIVLLGLIAGLVVWDILRYDTTIQTEVGYRYDGHPPVVVHVIATIVVGVIGGIGALFAYALTPTISVGTPQVLPFSIIAITLGAIILLIAFR